MPALRRPGVLLNCFGGYESMASDHTVDFAGPAGMRPSVSLFKGASLRQELVETFLPPVYHMLQSSMGISPASCTTVLY